MSFGFGFNIWLGKPLRRIIRWSELMTPNSREEKARWDNR